MSVSDLNFTADGTVTEVKPVSTASAGALKIIDMIEDAETPTADISRMIALEMARVMAKMSESDPLVRGNFKYLTEQLKALQLTQRSLAESESMSRKDALNLDGPKFKLVFTEIIRFFRKAMENSGLGNEQAQNIMLQFSDLVKANDENLRREVAKLDKGN